MNILKPVLYEENVIVDHQFGVSENHSTVEQVHRVRVVDKTRQSLEKKKNIVRLCKSSIWCGIRDCF